MESKLVYLQSLFIVINVKLKHISAYNTSISVNIHDNLDEFMNSIINEFSTIPLSQSSFTDFIISFKGNIIDVITPYTKFIRPTAEVPVRVPAGTLYKAQDPFKDKPDEDFGLEFSEDFKDTSVKKR